MFAEPGNLFEYVSSPIETVYAMVQQRNNGRVCLGSLSTAQLDICFRIECLDSQSTSITCFLLWFDLSDASIDRSCFGYCVYLSITTFE